MSIKQFWKKNTDSSTVNEFQSHFIYSHLVLVQQSLGVFYLVFLKNCRRERKKKLIKDFIDK